MNCVSAKFLSFNFKQIQSLEEGGGGNTPTHLQRMWAGWVGLFLFYGSDLIAVFCNSWVWKYFPCLPIPASTHENYSCVNWYFWGTGRHKQTTKNPSNVFRPVKGSWKLTIWNIKLKRNFVPSMPVNWKVKAVVLFLGIIFKYASYLTQSTVLIWISFFTPESHLNEGMLSWNCLLLWHEKGKKRKRQCWAS